MARDQRRHVRPVGGAAVAVEGIHGNEPCVRQKPGCLASRPADEESRNGGAVIRQRGDGAAGGLSHDLDGLILQSVMLDIDAGVDHPDEGSRPALRSVRS